MLCGFKIEGSLQVEGNFKHDEIINMEAGLKIDVYKMKGVLK